MEPEADATIEAFLRADIPSQWSRRPLGRRFAAYLTHASPEAVSDLARFEAAVTYPAASDPVAATFTGQPGSDEELRVAEGIEVLRVQHAVTEDTPSPLPEPAHWVIWQALDGDLRLLVISEAAASLLEGGAGDSLVPMESGLEPEEVALLQSHGVLAPVRWALDVLPDEGL